jgi:hypothetical protein
MRGSSAHHPLSRRRRAPARLTLHGASSRLCPELSTLWGWRPAEWTKLAKILEPPAGLAPASLAYRARVLRWTRAAGADGGSRTRAPVLPRPWTAVIRHRRGAHERSRTSVPSMSRKRSAVDLRGRKSGRAPATCTPRLLHPKQAGRCLPLSPWRERRESHPLWLSHGQPCKAVTLRPRRILVGPEGFAPSSPAYQADALTSELRADGAASGFRPRDLRHGKAASY